jgi:hypothetical protein
MTMEARLLPSADWPRLVNTELETAVPFLPEDTRVLVVEDDRQQIVRCWGLPRYLHAEGLWAHPSQRGGLRSESGRLLLQAMYREARASGDRVILTAALTPEIERLCRHVGGQQLPGTHWVLPIPTGGPF